MNYEPFGPSLLTVYEAGRNVKNPHYTHPDFAVCVELMECIRSLLAMSFNSCTILASSLW